MRLKTLSLYLTVPLVFSFKTKKRAKEKLKTLPGKNTISRMSMDVGLVINDGNLYQKKYRGW